MISFLRPRAVIWSLLFGLAVSLPFFSTARFRRDIYYFEVTVTSDSPGLIQIFYDIGRNFGQEDSSTQQLNHTTKPVRFRFGLPPATYRSMRLDPINGTAFMTVSDPRIVDRYGTIIRQFPLDQLRPNNDIATSIVKGDVLEMRTKPGVGDPNYTIPFSEPMTLVVGLKYWILASFKPFLVGFFGMLALSAVPYRRLLAGRGERLAAWSQAHPFKSVALLSVVVVCIQCHPVIFFGKSFVSPNNAVLLLYDDFPVLPGYKSTVLENAQNSDVGALMFWHLYCPVIAHDALFRDHELPLWNRYAFGGLPLLAQGQTMIGDPLNWISILTRSAAWSWDLRFVISRWLLCCGLGLTIFLLTRSLPAALLGAVAGGFLGFFAFRLNHPANFSVAYSPWIFFACLRLIAAPTLRLRARWVLLLMLVNFAIMNSGTMKEAYMLIACLNLAGLLLLCVDAAPWRTRLQAGLLAAAGGAVVLLLSAPTLLTFVTTLKLSWTTYDVPSAAQAPITQVIGFFDDLFSRQLRPGEVTYLPATNFLMLFGVLWALASLRALLANRSFVVIALAALVPFTMVFGIMPASWIISIPFIANILHIDNTLSCPLMIFAGVLAGYGFAAFFDRVGREGWARDFTLYALLLGALASVYVSAMQQVIKSPFFLGYAWSLILAVVSLPVFLHLAWKKSDSTLFATTLLGGVALLTWRHSQYLSTPFDDYVFNPQVRANLHPTSPVMKFLDEKLAKEPSRPVGFGLNLFPSYNTMLGWESVLGVDPLRNRYQDDMGFAFGIPRIRNADQPIVDAAHTPLIQPGLDMLNVRYYLYTHSDPPIEIPGLKRVGQFDMDVFESATAWPRAFFTDRVTFYQDAGALAAKAKDGDRRPFAALQLTEKSLPSGPEGMSQELASRTVQPATGYHLTTNTTSFDVQAPSAGIIVLDESFYRGEFRAKVNGHEEPYFRVNHTAKGIYVGGPGTYHVEFDYWPSQMTLSLVLAAVGFAAVLAGAWVAFGPRREIRT